MEGPDNRTEHATAKRREEARNKGQLCMSEEIVSLVVLFLAVVVLRLSVPTIYRLFCATFEAVCRVPADTLWTVDTVRAGFLHAASLLAAMLGPVFGATVVGAVVASMSQTGPFFSMEALHFRLAGLNPIANAKQLFSSQALVRLGLAMLKVALVALMIYAVVRRKLPELPMLAHVTPAAFTRWTFLLLYRVALAVLALFILIAALDWCHKKYKYERDLMMTKQEVKDERKQYEQSPLVRQAQRRKMRELTMMRMMAAVPKASVVVTNPTHVAVAIEYDPAKMDAPRLTAKGLRLVAERIKEIARAHGIPILERPELARAIYKDVQLGREIPSRFYEAVAEILAYLHRLGRLRVNPVGSGPEPRRRGRRVPHG